MQNHILSIEYFTLKYMYKVKNCISLQVANPSVYSI